jgi:ubiquinone/menaquinone biosynthesis C-methylase UbiE
MTDDGELRRLEAVYAGYDANSAEQAKRDPANAGLAQIQTERARVLGELLESEGLMPLTGKRVLDVGSGLGDELARLITGGADPKHSVGVDLLPDRVEKASRLHPSVRFVRADARRLPLDDSSFDLVLANVVFSSILDDDVASAVAREMRRVLAQDGAIVWWDNRYPTPGNPNVRGYRLREIKRLFPDCRIQASTTTLLPPLARRLRRSAPLLYGSLAQVRFLRARHLAVIRPGSGPGIQAESEKQGG